MTGNSRNALRRKFPVGAQIDVELLLKKKKNYVEFESLSDRDSIEKDGRNNSYASTCNERGKRGSVLFEAHIYQSAFV